MADVNRGTSYGATETITNTKLHLIVDDATVTNIVDADCASGMALSDTKLDDITTGNKVGGTALFGLASTPSGSGVIPYANIPQTSFASIANTEILPISLASWVSGSSFKNLASTPSGAGIIPYNNIVSSLASGGYIQYGGSNTFVGAGAAGNFNLIYSDSASTALTTGNITIAPEKRYFVVWETDSDGAGNHYLWLRFNASSTASGYAWTTEERALTSGTTYTTTNDSSDAKIDFLNTDLIANSSNSGWSRGEMWIDTHKVGTSYSALVSGEVRWKNDASSDRYTKFTGLNQENLTISSFVLFENPSDTNDTFTYSIKVYEITQS